MGIWRIRVSFAVEVVCSVVASQLLSLPVLFVGPVFSGLAQ